MGTPDAPSTAAVRRYLAEFLSDKRVVDMSRWLWLPLLHGLILRRRPQRSAALYKKIWRTENNLSPLLHFTQLQCNALKESLGEQANVRFAMRYGNPSVTDVLDELLACGVEKLLIFPLYPQFSASTTGSGFDAIHNYFSKKRSIPTLRFASPFHEHPLYIAAMAKQFLQQNITGDDLFYLFSFHGLPKRHEEQGDPYARQCKTTARLLAKELNLVQEQWQLTFQSRFGREEWLLPATDTELARLPTIGKKRLVTICPGFVADCLETLEEIAVEGKKIFMEAGGESFHYIPCLNGSKGWLTALDKIVRAELVGWE